ncbi:glycoside hydrolase family 9 protein [Cohnella hongkongensis]|uniref:Endoglucanase n=1 Tax=Cohnella hongkongensis TaxID=178337 RepID=A0ABV9FBY5_9BACL
MNGNQASKMAAVVLLGGTVLQGCVEGGPSAPSASPATKPSAASASAPAPSEGKPAMELRIHLNQIGYGTEAAKTAVIAADEPYPELKAVVTEAHGGGRPVWEGTAPAAQYDKLSGDWVSRIDFTELKAEGQYRMEAEGSVSPPFRIGRAVYDELADRVARSYRLQRSGQEIDDPALGLRVEAGHLQDREAVLFYEDERGRRPIVDASGGWYDAGDYGKYVPPAAVTVAQLMLAYELRPDFFAERKFLSEGEKSHWERAGGAPDLLTEIKFELDWLLRMQREDGAVYHKVSGGVFPDFIAPAEDVQDRSVYGLSTYGTAMFAAATAMGARVFEPFDAAYAAELLDRAQRAQSWLDRHPDAYFRLDELQNSGSGPYDKSTDREERYWALAELLKTTGEARYGEALASGYADLSARLPGTVGWNDGQLLGQWAEATAERASASGKEAAARAIDAAAAEIVANIERDGYRSSLKEQDYTWASNKIALAKGELLLLANELAPASEYVAGAADQLHYVLGRNALGMSFVTGAGTTFPKRPHHRISAASGILVPGLLVGGPNRQLNDPVLEKLAGQGLPPAKSYVDDLFSYAGNEYAIDYNAPLLFTLAFLE